MRRHVNRSSCRIRDERNLWDKYESRLRLLPVQIEDVYNALEELGVRRSAQIALLHVRNATYDQLIKLPESTFQHYRNSNPVNCQLAVDELNNRGFAVVAIGNEDSWSSGLVDVVDYSGSKHRSELRDVAIGAIASLYVGSEAAPSNLPMLFRKPQLIINNTRIAELLTSSQLKVHIFKRHLLDGRVLTQTEIWENDLADYLHDSEIIDSGLVLIENTAEEIHAGLLNLLELVDSAGNYSKMKSELQQRSFWARFAVGLSGRTQFATRHGELRALVAPSFLRSRSEWTL